MCTLYVVVGRMDIAYDHCIRSFQISLICVVLPRSLFLYMRVFICMCRCAYVRCHLFSLLPVCFSLLSSLSLCSIWSNKLIKKSFFWYLAGAMHKLNGKLIQLYVGVLLTQNEMLQLILWGMEMFYPNWFLSSLSLSFFFHQKGFAFLFFLVFRWIKLSCALSISSEANFIKENDERMLWMWIHYTSSIDILRHI